MQDKHLTSHKDELPENFDSLEQFWGFWDSHSSTDYEDLMEPLEVEIDLKSSRVYLALAKDLLLKARTQARKQGISTETLVNLWLQEKLTTLA